MLFPSDEGFPRVDLAETWPDLARELVLAFASLGREELVDDVTRLSIPAQTLGGSPHDFQMLAFSFPRLTREQRYAMVFRVDEEEFELEAAGAKVRIVLDNFGRITWLRISGAPNQFEPLQAALRAHRLAKPPASRPGALSPQVAALVAVGRRFEAIKLYRQETGESLKQAKAVVEVATAATVLDTGH